MKKIGFIDPYVVSPAINCFNSFVNLFDYPTTYHLPSQNGTRTLLYEKDQTHAYIIVGSASHVTEPLDWHAPLAQFLLEELKRGKPVMGCCFGHQLLCHALGSTVEFLHANQDKESGVRKITFNQDISGFKNGESFTLSISHRQVVSSLGTGLKEVGFGLKNDFVIHETLPLFTTQAHPEASDFVLRNDIKNLNETEIMKAKKDGDHLITRFFREHLK
jgi:GMP synthase-like glutamine amidotransferase